MDIRSQDEHSRLRTSKSKEQRNRQEAADTVDGEFKTNRSYPGITCGKGMTNWQVVAV